MLTVQDSSAYTSGFDNVGETERQELRREKRGCCEDIVVPSGRCSVCSGSVHLLNLIYVVKNTSSQWVSDNRVCCIWHEFHIKFKNKNRMQVYSLVLVASICARMLFSC